MQKPSIVLVSVLVVAFGSGSIARAQSTDASTPGTAPTSIDASTSTSATSRADERRAIGNTLWVTGLSVFAATYALTGIAGTTLVKVANGRDVTIGESWIPLAGPWIMLADSRGFDTTQFALTLVSGILQTLGCAAFIAGLVLENESPSDPAAARVWLAPTFGSQGAGLSVVGSF